MTADDIIANIIREEGIVYTDDPEDKGGPTKFGITLETLQQWRPGSTISDLQNLTIVQAHDCYSHLYVAPFTGLQEPLLGLVVDCAVQHGVGRTHIWLGQCGDDYAKLLAKRIQFYGKIVVQDSTQLKFLDGWLVRATSFIR